MPDIYVKDDILFIKHKPINPSRITVLFPDLEFFDNLFLIKIDSTRYTALLSLSSRLKKPVHQIIDEALDRYIDQNLES